MPCPSDEELTTFVEGTLDAGTMLKVEAHFDACPVCHRVVGALATASRSRRSVTGTDAGIVARLQAMRPLAAGSELGRFVVRALVGEGASGIV